MKYMSQHQINKLLRKQKHLKKKEYEKVRWEAYKLAHPHRARFLDITFSIGGALVFAVLSSLVFGRKR